MIVYRMKHFFRYCGELLEKFSNNPQVMHIGGNNFLMGKKLTKDSYFFSNQILCSGGWATWRRAWKDYDINIGQWPAIRDSSLLQEVVEHPAVIAHLRDTFDRLHKATDEDMDVWDYQWSLLCWIKRGLAVLPSSTLVSNIGFGHPHATHTSCASDSLALLTGWLKMKAMKFPLRHPVEIKRNTEADRFITDNVIAPCRERPKGIRTLIKKASIEFFQSRPSLRSPRAFSNRVSRFMQSWLY